jgi:uncharacterized protein YbjQ (UPF0145 family)
MDEKPNPMTSDDPNIRQLPEHALRRLRSMRGEAGGPPRLFTSDLSVGEFLLIEQAGFEPIGFVMGSSFFHIGIQWTIQPFQNYELDVLTSALYHAREHAMARMEEEAHLLDADGVVGVRLEVGKFSWAQSMAEFTAVGTAVRARANDGRRFRRSDGRPFTSDLSGQEFWTLLRAGCRPLALAMGNCVYHVGRRGFRQALGQFGRNVEMPNYTQAIYNARELALERMQADAEVVHAHGIVGVQVQQANHGWNHHVMEFFAIGTAVARESEPAVLPEPLLVLSLNAPPAAPARPVAPPPKPAATPSHTSGGE